MSATAPLLQSGSDDEANLDSEEKVENNTIISWEDSVEEDQTNQEAESTSMVSPKYSCDLCAITLGVAGLLFLIMSASAGNEKDKEFDLKTGSWLLSACALYLAVVLLKSCADRLLKKDQATSQQAKEILNEQNKIHDINLPEAIQIMILTYMYSTAKMPQAEVSNKIVVEIELEIPPNHKFPNKKPSL